ncbi:hypothetical protein [Boseongicola aestuarii]|nr:hypothetical protein [Boseongicola aestuarii]
MTDVVLKGADGLADDIACLPDCVVAIIVLTVLDASMIRLLCFGRDIGR